MTYPKYGQARPGTTNNTLCLPVCPGVSRLVVVLPLPRVRARPARAPCCCQLQIVPNSPVKPLLPPAPFVCGHGHPQVLPRRCGQRAAAAGRRCARRRRGPVGLSCAAHAPPGGRVAPRLGQAMAGLEPAALQLLGQCTFCYLGAPARSCCTTGCRWLPGTCLQRALDGVVWYVCKGRQNLQPCGF